MAANDRNGGVWKPLNWEPKKPDPRADELTDVAITALANFARLGLPLQLAADAAGLDSNAIQYALIRGRRLIRGETFPKGIESERFDQRCVELATRWDKALPETIAQLSSYLLVHAKSDAKVAEKMLRGATREQRRRVSARSEYRKRLALAASATQGPSDDLSDAVPGGVDDSAERALAADGTPDLDETFEPLDLVGDGQQGPIFLRATAGDSSATLGVFQTESDQRSVEELDHYARSGRWPEDEAIDTIGESMPDRIEPTATAAELGTGAELLAGALEAGGAMPDAPKRKRAAARRVEPFSGAIELTAGERVQRVEQATITVAAPAVAPLRRIDPWERR